MSILKHLQNSETSKVFAIVPYVPLDAAESAIASLALSEQGEKIFG